MAEEIKELLTAYEGLINILQQQLIYSKQERTDESIEVLNGLEHSKEGYKQQVDLLLGQHKERIDSSSELQAIILTRLDQLQELNASLQAEIEIWYDNDSSTMRQVSHHQKTLRTYGGVNYSDSISYYIDSKK